MANGYSVYPLNDEQFSDQSFMQFLEDELIFFPENVLHGRFPTLAELRNTIQELGYALEENQDWYVTSKDDFTEIWFSGKKDGKENPAEFWFRRGGMIVLDIAQSLANTCGSLLVISHTGSPIVLVLPDSLFPVPLDHNNQGGFVTVISHRLPVMIERLPEASRQEIPFLLSQIRQALRSIDPVSDYEFYQAVQKGLSAYRRLLNHADTHVRYLAFYLVATFRENFYESAEMLRLAIKNERDPATKERMIYTIEKLVVPAWIGAEIDLWTRSLLNLLREMSDNTGEVASIRLAAANLLALAQPGLLTTAMRTIFINALIRHQQNQHSPYNTIERVLKSIEKLLLYHRIEILMTALPQIAVAQYAHEVLRALLDHAFFGAIRPTQMSTLTATQIAERPEVDETRFRDDLPRNWLYPANPTKLASAELLPIQRHVLETVIDLDVPWMVHSNLLEKYGLPPTRASVRDFLKSGQ